MDSFKTLYLNFVKDMYIVDKAVFKKYYKKQTIKQFDINFVKSFFDRLQPFENEIKEEKIELINNQDFTPLLNMKLYELCNDVTDNNKKAIMKHIKTCYSVSQYIVQNAELSNKVEENKIQGEESENKEGESDSPFDQTLESAINGIDEETKDKLNNLHKEINECLPENLLEDMFKDFSNVNIEDMFKDENMLKNMAKTVEDKIKSGEINQEQLLETAQGMMGTFGDLLGDNKDLLSTVTGLMGGGDSDGANPLSSVMGLLGNLGGDSSSSSATNPIGSVMNLIGAMNGSGANAGGEDNDLSPDEKAMLRRYRKKKQNHRALLKKKLKNKQRGKRNDRKKK